MHRFGRTAQQKMKDRWGGGFILATVLALAAAYYAGTWLSQNIGAGKTGTNNPPGVSTNTTKPTGTTSPAASVQPGSFTLHFVQAGNFASPSNARRRLQDVIDHDYAALVTPKTAAGVMKVMAGPFLDAESAAAAKEELKAAGISDVFVQTVSLTHNSEAIPAAAMTNKSTDVKGGLDTLNAYLHEVAIWIDEKAGGMAADSTNAAKHGKALGELAAKMTDEKDAKVQSFIKMATAAADNATAIEASALAEPGSVDYQNALTSYYALLDSYQTFSAK